MKIEEVIKYFGTYYRVAKDVGFAMNTPRNWARIGYIPSDAQIKIERYTSGALKLDFNDVGDKYGNQG